MITILYSLGVGMVLTAVLFLLIYSGIWAANHNDDRVAVVYCLVVLTLIFAGLTYGLQVSP